MIKKNQKVLANRLKGGNVMERKEVNYATNRVRVHVEYLRRLSALAPWINTRPEYSPDGVLKIGERLRLALCVGIEALEDKKRQVSRKDEGD